MCNLIAKIKKKDNMLFSIQILIIADGEIFFISCGIIFFVAKYILYMSNVLMAEQEQISVLNLNPLMPGGNKKVTHT